VFGEFASTIAADKKVVCRCKACCPHDLCYFIVALGMAPTDRNLARTDSNERDVQITKITHLGVESNLYIV